MIIIINMIISLLRVLNTLLFPCNLSHNPSTPGR